MKKRKRRTRRDLTPSERQRDRRLAIKALGRPLASKHPIHHHSLTQLVICEDLAYHMLLHLREETVKHNGDPATERLCLNCGELLPMAMFRDPNKDRWCGPCWTGNVGWCLYVYNEVQAKLGLPQREYGYAYRESQADKMEHLADIMPDFSVPVWFSSCSSD